MPDDEDFHVLHHPKGGPGRPRKYPKPPPKPPRPPHISVAPPASTAHQPTPLPQKPPRSPSGYQPTGRPSGRPKQIKPVASVSTFKLTQRQQELNRILGGDARHILLVGGGRSGKTFLIIRALIIRALGIPDSRHVVVRFRYNHVRASVWLDTFPKVMKLCFPGVTWEEHRFDGYISFPNGSEIWFAGLDEKERVEKILGMEFLSVYFNECSQLPWASVLIMRTRLAQSFPGARLRAFYDLNPTGTGHWTHKLFLEKVDPDSRKPIGNPEDYAWQYINPYDNKENLDPAMLREYENMPPRMRRRFLEGVYVAEVDGALWSYEVLEHARIDRHDLPMHLVRVVVAVDPSGTSGEETKRSDDVGIVAAGLDSAGQAYVLADRTCNLPPEGWAREVTKLYKEFAADRIIVERNFGGDMCRAVIHAADRNMRIKMITASRGKVIRAEPISAMYGYEINSKWMGDRVRHVGEFKELEDEMLNFAASGYQGGRSPNRADALIIALSELLLRPATDVRIRRGPSPLALPIYAR